MPRSAVGVVASAILLIVIAPIARPAVVRYDVVVQPIETTQLAITLETASGDVQERRALDVSDGWSGTTGAVDTTENLPLHWTFVGSPDDRLAIDGFPLDARVLIDVNGKRTETAAGPASVLSLRELGAPVSRLDRAALGASWIADVVLLLALGVAVVGLVERWRRRSTAAGQPTKSGVLHFAAFPMAVWTSLVVVFWPGMMNPDSVGQWRQVETGNLQDRHPYPVNVGWGLLQQIVDIPALPILVTAGCDRTPRRLRGRPSRPDRRPSMGGVDRCHRCCGLPGHLDSHGGALEGHRHGGRCARPHRRTVAVGTDRFEMARSPRTSCRVHRRRVPDDLVEPAQRVADRRAPAPGAPDPAPQRAARRGRHPGDHRCTRAVGAVPR